MKNSVKEREGILSYCITIDPTIFYEPVLRRIMRLLLLAAAAHHDYRFSTSLVKSIGRELHLSDGPGALCECPRDCNYSSVDDRPFARMIPSASRCDDGIIDAVDRVAGRSTE